MAPVRRKRRKDFDLDLTLRRRFGKCSFRPLQREVITTALDGEDVFLQAATSFGKSLCYQLPAVVDYGITIVISPLLSLMNNQVAALQAAGIEVGCLNSTTSRDVKTELISDLQTGHPHTRLLYVTPEYTTLDYFRRILRTIHMQCELSRIAIDEAHCISEWGHDFRPAFKALSFFKTEFPDVPMICLTATATAEVREDIITVLGLDPRKLKIYTMTTARPNLHYEVRFKTDDQDHYNDFLKWLKAVHNRRRSCPERNAQLTQVNERVDNVCGIIYTLFRKDCESLAARLCGDGIGAKPYHAGLENSQKNDHLAGWVANKQGYDVIVATTAFGMGIDKENVRFVVHWQIPKSFEGFYQEAGRAGRDGKASLCIMYYSREDRDRSIQMLSKDQAKQAANKHGSFHMSEQAMNRAKSLQALIAYCENTGACRHHLICQYFGEEIVPECDYACDWHKDKRALERAKKEGLASEDWCSTQRDSGAYAVDEYE
ncbi:ATP-dependent DNA helicase [Rhizodiscina lignyota]|uniref:ATP-dependent DNA helicase n=1 Tax=Rhizodiscina lignyota TaxID=1504668 RepID=A0A9P4IFD0_9PEZI|nr:ATP-dependent DNA helicase [Rhizodiscina lignyota]